MSDLTPEALQNLRTACEEARRLWPHIRQTRADTLPGSVAGRRDAWLAAVSPDVVLGMLDTLAEARGYGAADYAADLCRVMEGRGVPVPADAHGAFEQCLRMIGTMDVPGEARRQRDDEAWMHAACLSIAEGVKGWDVPVPSCDLTGIHDSLAMQKVRALRAERDELAAEGAAFVGKPEGALPGWKWSEADGPAWLRKTPRGAMVASVRGTWSAFHAGRELADGYAPTPRAAMRLAEAAAKARGWLK